LDPIFCKTSKQNISRNRKKNSETFFKTTKHFAKHMKTGVKPHEISSTALLCQIEEKSSMPMLLLSVKMLTCVGGVGQRGMFGVG
jgi:hypothetical protein